MKTLPVNAPDLDTATFVAKDLFRQRGYRVLKLTLQSTGPVRPFSEVAIEVPGCTSCFVFAVNVRKV